MELISWFRSRFNYCERGMLWRHRNVVRQCLTLHGYCPGYQFKSRKNYIQINLLPSSVRYAATYDLANTQLLIVAETGERSILSLLFEREKKQKAIIFFSFTLYPACSRVDRGNQVLRQSADHFPQNSGGIAY